MSSPEAEERLLIESIQDGYFEIDLAGTFTRVNLAACKIFGCSKDEIIGINYRDYTTKESAEKAFKVFNYIYMSGAPGKLFDYELTRKDGTRRQIELSASLIKDESGKPVGFRGTARDVTDRRQIEERLRRSEERYRTIIEDMQDAYFELDLKGSFKYVNDALCNSLGYSRDELIGVSYRHYAGLRTVKEMHRLFKGVYRTGIPVRAYSFELYRKDGSKIYSEISISLIRNKRGGPIGFRGTARDITERRQMEERLRRSEERYRTIIEDMEDGYFELDLRGNFTFANSAASRHLGYSRSELIGISNRQIASEKSVREMGRVFGGIYKTGIPVKAHAFELFRKDSSKLYAELSIALIRNKIGEPVGFRGIARDITERKEYEEQIRHMATHDILTGLPNRIMFRELLQQNIESAKRYRQQFALLFMDLDGFKMINDTFGHDTGDQMLIVCATRLEQSLRASDFIARLGGDEFVILVKNVTGKKSLITLVNKILSVVREPIIIRKREHYFTASIGISIYPQDGQDKQSLMRTADMAMYSAKDKGSNNYQFYSVGLKSNVQERSKFEEHLPHALERGEIFLEYQPKLDLRSGVITGVEALVRWRNPVLGLIMPKRMIPVAESTGLIIPIGKWVLTTACLQNIAWQRRGLPKVVMAVNLSHRQLMDEDLIESIEDALSVSGLEPELLELEITENLLMTHFPRILNVLARLKELGVRLALDDLGTGYSTLSQIRHLPVDTLKIDRSIICNIPENSIDMAIAQAIIGIGRALQQTTVVEGVETPEQLAFARSVSCDMMQGFYFSRPLSPEHIAELLSKNAIQPETWDTGEGPFCS